MYSYTDIASTPPQSSVGSPEQSKWHRPRPRLPGTSVLRPQKHYVRQGSAGKRQGGGEDAIGRSEFYPCVVVTAASLVVAWFSREMPIRLEDAHLSLHNSLKRAITRGVPIEMSYDRPMGTLKQNILISCLSFLPPNKQIACVPSFLSSRSPAVGVVVTCIIARHKTALEIVCLAPWHVRVWQRESALINREHVLE